MAQFEESYHRRRAGASYVTTVISITLVLFMLGLLGMMVLHARKISEYVKENIGFSIMVKEGVRESSIFELKKRLDAEPFVKTADYVSRDRAAREFSEELGEDFVTFLGYNPLLPSIELRLRAGYANPDSIRKIETFLLSNTEVKEVVYHRPLVDQINRNVNKISIVILAFSMILLIISVVLINNTIRLAVYAKRFLIRSMQLVGATQGFIRRPFLWRALLQGFVSSLLAIASLLVVMYFTLREIPELVEISDLLLFGILFAAVLLLGMFITWLSTWLAVRKYLRMKTDLLYQ
jgi:cell division transport system permease protein